jgi:glycosyltransferase involved in cell wall biosynthesis
LKIAIFGNGIISNSIGGAQKHMREVILFLSKEYEITYFPEIEMYNNKEINYDFIKTMESKNIQIADFNNKNFKNAKNTIPSYTSEIKEFKFIYDLDYQYYLDNIKNGGPISNVISKKAGIPLGACFQDLGDVNSSFSGELYSMYKLSRLAPSFSFFIVPAGFYDYFNRNITVNNLLSNKNLKFISVINKEYKKNLVIKFGNVEIIDPSNALDDNIKKYKGMEKENKIIFFARLIYRKGIFDLVSIARNILKKCDVKIIVSGSFARQIEEMLFLKSLKKFNLQNNVIYVGALPDEELYKEISTSKVMLYPSHSDSFSISILQAIYLNVYVSTYDIPGLSLYKNLRAVAFSKEFDTEALADSAVKFLNMQEDVFNDENILEFLQKYSSWNNVAKSHISIIDKYIK